MPLPKRVLIVDDFGQMRSTLKQMLQSIGFEEIDMVGNGKEALDHMRRKPYDIILCDYNLGEGKDGQAVLEEAKHRGFIRSSTVFVIITAENTTEMVMGAVEHRPDDYLTKPFTKELLRTRLERQMARKESLQEIDRAIQKGDLQQAIALCDARIADHPRNLTEFLRLKASLCMRTGDLAGAEAVYDEALAARRVAWAQVGLGEVRRAQRRLAEAREIFRAVIEQTPTYMEAHDLLARTLDEMGESAEAQRVLAEATRISPKSVRRQHALGGLAVKNEDLDTAEKAFRRTIALGRTSVYRDPSHFTALADVQSKSGALGEALKTLGSVRKEFGGDDKAGLQASVAEVLILTANGRAGEAGDAVAEASRLFEAVGGKLPPDAAMEFAKAQFLAGDKSLGLRVMQDLVRNNHEDLGLLDRAQATFSAVGMEEEGREVIKNTAGEVVRLNNSGVSLVKEGKIAEAIQLFEEAIASMPDNRTINLNTAQALLLYMQRNGAETERLAQARSYLDRVRSMDPDNATLAKLIPIYERLAGGAK